MEQFNVTGMSCAACSARVEKAVREVPGVSSCSVSLLTNSMGVEGDASEADIIKAVQEAGYGASLRTSGKTADHSAEENALEDHETPMLRKRLISSLGFLAVLMYFSMGHGMWGWPVPSWFEDNPVALGILQLLLSAVVMVINQRFFIGGFKSMLHLAPNMDSLVALGSFAAFAWSVYALFAMTAADGVMAMAYMHQLYFESAAMILTLITVGKMLEARSKGRTTDALRGLMRLAPKTATIVKDGREEAVPIERVFKGTVFVVRPGEAIPVDGLVIEGLSAVNEAALTGESLPVDKAEGDSVSAGTINQSGYLKCLATKVGDDTTLSQIIRMVSDAAATKAPIAKVADKVSGVFVPVVISISIVTIVLWLLLGRSFDYALARGISVLVISCPCALGLATPVAIMVGNGMGARNGILFKTSQSLEQTGKALIVALDKTGTITTGNPVVTDVLPVEGLEGRDLVGYAASLESRSEHPLARAITAYADVKRIPRFDVTGFKALVGSGVSARLADDGPGNDGPGDSRPGDSRLANPEPDNAPSDSDAELLGGSLSFMERSLDVPDGLRKKAVELSNQGKTPLLFAKGGRPLGIIAVADAIKDDAREAVEQLHNMGILTVMLSGDNRNTAEAIARQAGIDHVVAGVLPDGKETVVKALQEKGSVIMVGDGINDAPALTRADIGIAIGAGADVAIDAADVVLMKSGLLDVPAAIRLSRATLRNIKENLFWAFFYNVIGIPLAAGCYAAFGLTLNPMFGAAAMSLSSFCVVSNALRLNLLDVHGPRRDRKLRNALYNMAEIGAAGISMAETGKEEEESTGMTRIIDIEGMMCPHCEAHVKRALESLDGVKVTEISHERKSAVVELPDGVSEGRISRAVEEAGYRFKGMR